jgi:hypothetical protein
MRSIPTAHLLILLTNLLTNQALLRAAGSTPTTTQPPIHLATTTAAIPVYQNQEQRLYRKLLNSYDPAVRPVVNHSSTLEVILRVKLYQILELSEKDQTLTTNMWMEQKWIDQHLMWDLEDHASIRTLRVPSNRVWLPDTYIYNSASKEGSQGQIHGPYVMLSNDGAIKFPVPMKLKSNCEVEITYFPFDEQICYIKYLLKTEFVGNNCQFLK